MDCALLIDFVTDGAMHPDLVLQDALAERRKTAHIRSLAFFEFLLTWNSLDAAPETEVSLKDSLDVVELVGFEGLAQERLVAGEPKLFAVKDAHEHLEIGRIDRLPKNFYRYIA